MLELKEYTIPISIVQYVIQNNIVKAFSIFIYLKSLCNGVLHSSNLSYASLCEATGIKDLRTIKKYLKKLLSLDWIGFNKKTGNYFIRSFSLIQKIEGIRSRRGIRVDISRLKVLKYQLCAGLIAFKLNGLKIAQRAYLRKRVGKTALKKHGALQSTMASLNLRQYFGLSNTQLGELFNCSKSEANRIKISCVTHGLLIVNKKFKLIACFDKPDYLFKSLYSNPNRVRVTGDRKFGIKVYEQLTDELIPMVFCVKTRH